MVRLACVNVGNLPLQLLYRKHPEWRDLPAAVVSKDSPYGRILTANARAGEYGIRAGLRYAGALSLNHELRADTVAEQTVTEGADYLAGELSRYSPQVEIDRGEPGIYWLEAGGLSSLYPDLRIWCKQLRRCLAKKGFTATVAVGYSRFGCYAAAKSIQDQVLFPHHRSERDYALQAGIRVLKFPAAVVQRLEMLGVHSVGSFLELQPGAVGKRFGPEVRRLHRFAAGDLDIAPQATEMQEDPQWAIKLPYAEPAGDCLLDAMRRSLREVTGGLRKTHRLIRELRICFVLDGSAQDSFLVEPILPSSPSLDIDLLVNLIALRMENLRLPSAATAIRMSAKTVRERNIQNELFSVVSKRSRQEVDKVFARFRGLWGNSCVQRARLEDEHMPERSYSWEDLRGMPWESERDLRAVSYDECLPQTKCRGARQGVRPVVRQTVRRIFSDPRLLPPQRFTKYWGPYPISARWWWGEHSRQYCYGETRSGEILWLRSSKYKDQWLQIGVVE